LVADAVAGIADPATGRPVTSDTPFFSYSIGKGVAATVVHVLAERGVLDYDTPIVELWPEFGAHGKEKVTLRHALSQSAGVPGLPSGLTVEDMCDWDKMCAIIADAEPWWEAGTKIGYHAVTFGYIVGEIVRRASGKPISQVLWEEVAGPLGIADELFFAIPASEQGRLARLEDAPIPPEMAADGHARGLAAAQARASRMHDCRVWQPCRRAERQHSGWRHGDCSCRGTHVRRAAGRSGWRAADLATTAARRICRGHERSRPNLWLPDRLGAGLLDRTIHVERARDPKRLRGGWHRWKLCVRRYHESNCVRLDQESARAEFRDC
jgi:CubicO group peptidase (beta-lactamase class C family)